MKKAIDYILGIQLKSIGLKKGALLKMMKVFVILFLLFCFKGEACPEAFNSQLDLRGSKWNKKNLVDLRVEKVILENGLFKGILIEGVNFKEVNGVGADFSYVIVRNSVFKKAQMINSVFHRGKFSKVFFIDSDFTNSDFSYVVAELMVLKRTILRWANLRYSKMKHTDFTGSDFTHTDLTNADLSFSILHGVKFKHTKIEGAKFLGAKVGKEQAEYLKEHLRSQGLKVVGGVVVEAPPA